MIVSDKILSKEVEADQLKVTLHYTVIENIAEPQPISESDIQGRLSNGRTISRNEPTIGKY